MSRLRGFFLTVGLLVGLVPGVPRAQVPDSDIWVADVVYRDGAMQFLNPVNVTRRVGYDNQPCFLADDSGFLFARADTSGSTDIFRWSEKSGIVRVTNTQESEYSPTPLEPPGSGFCTVRVEADSVTQRLWRFETDGTNPRLVMSDVDSVGYFAWIDAGHVAVFVLGNEARKEPHTLRVVDVALQRETIVARDIGRAIHRIPGTTRLSFVAHEADDTFRFFMLKEGATVPSSLIDAIGPGQDAAWIGDILVMASGTAIHVSQPMNDAGWRQVADFASAGITGITRIAASSGPRIAFVAVSASP